MKNRELVVVLPAYNEEKDIVTMVERWQRRKIELDMSYNLLLQIVIVDDGSTDRTSKLAYALEDKYDNVRLIKHEKNKGLGKAVRTGFYHALKDYTQCEYVCLMDCDNTQDPSYIFSMIEKMEKKSAYDIVIASRYERGAKVHGLKNYRRWMSEAAKLVYQSILNIDGVKDYTCGYRLYRVEILKKGFHTYQKEFITQSGFTCMAEILYKLSLIGARCGEVPFELHYEEKAGTSKMKVVKTAINSIVMAVSLRYEQNRRRC